MIIKYDEVWDDYKIKCYIILSDDLEVIGNVEVMFDDDYTDRIVGLYIQPKYRKLGYSKLLMKEILMDFNENDLGLLVNKDNRIAINLYTSFGFIEDKDYSDKVYKYMIKKTI
jgi:ribosomal protein S18 acetylase RimI-like enzyme